MEQYSDKYVPLMNSLLFALADETKDCDVTMAEFRSYALGLREFYRLQRSGYESMVTAIAERMKQNQKHTKEFAKTAKEFLGRDATEVAKERARRRRKK